MRSPNTPVICDRALQAIQSGKNTYSFPEGIFELREAIALKLKHHNNIVADPLEEIVVTLDVSGGFIATITRDLYPGKSQRQDVFSRSVKYYC